MKKLLLILMTTTVFSCMITKPPPDLPVKGKNYLVPPFQVTTNKTFEQVWDKLIDVFAQKGLPIKIIDKSSGLLVSDRTLLPATNERDDLTLKDNRAYLVVPTKYDYTINRYKILGLIADVSGEWNVRVKRVNDETIININIVNVERRDAEGASYLVSDYRSTGEFEKIISDLIK